MRTHRLVGICQCVRHRAVLEVELGHHGGESVIDRYESCTGVMSDEGDKSVVPSLALQVQGAIKWMESGLLQGRGVPDVMEPGRRNQDRSVIHRTYSELGRPVCHPLGM